MSNKAPNSSEKDAALRQRVADLPVVSIPRVDLIWLRNETNGFLKRLARDVREGKNVMLASQFARWLEFSGLLKMLRAVPGGGEAWGRVRDLNFLCGELFRNGRADPDYAASDIAEINRKLDVILSQRRRDSDNDEALVPLRETPVLSGNENHTAEFSDGDGRTILPSSVVGREQPSETAPMYRASPERLGQLAKRGQDGEQSAA